MSAKKQLTREPTVLMSKVIEKKQDKTKDEIIEVGRTDADGRTSAAVAVFFGAIFPVGSSFDRERGGVARRQ